MCSNIEFRFARFLETLEALEEKHSNNINIKLAKGIVLDFLESNNAALNCFDKIISENKNIYLAYKYRSLFYKKRRKFNLALDDIEKAIKIKEDDSECHFIKAEIYRKLKKTNSAIVEYSRAININPNFEDAFRERGYLLRDNGKDELAKIDLERSEELFLKRKKVE